MPRWLARLEKSDKLFADDLYATIAAGEHFLPLWIDVPKLRLTSEEDARAYVAKHNLAAIIQHDSHHFSSKKSYAANVSLLQKYVPFLNSVESHYIGHDKLLTKQVLRKAGISVLDDAVVTTLDGLHHYIDTGRFYVIKPPDKGAGAGVKLVRKEGGRLLSWHNGAWSEMWAREKLASGGNRDITVRQRWSLPFLSETAYTYNRIMVEPFFNDGTESFASIRCTVIGKQVVESVRRVNKKNITSNVSSGGIAERIELTSNQTEMAIAAAQAIGADYAGVDLLVCGGASVIGEINIGPFTLFTDYTGVRAGKLFGNYVVQKLG